MLGFFISIVGEMMVVVGLYCVLRGQMHGRNQATDIPLLVQTEKTCINAEDQEPESAETHCLAK